MKTPLVSFIVLQVLDLGTTLAVLAMGGMESNPLVASLMTLGPFRGLVVAKALVIALAAVGCVMGRERALRLVNLVFTAVVVSNLSIIARLAL